MRISTQYLSGRWWIKVAHEPCTAFGTPAAGILLLAADAHDELNTLTEIELQQGEAQRHIFVHWRATQYVADSFHMLLPENSSVLYLGAGTFSAALDLEQMEVIHQKKVFLFWSFERVGDFVLERGELDCFLYGLDGELLASTPVEPPYEHKATDEGISIKCDDGSTRWLRFPGYGLHGG